MSIDSSSASARALAFLLPLDIKRERFLHGRISGCQGARMGTQMISQQLRQLASRIGG